jgi:hypothetical protein
MLREDVKLVPPLGDGSIQEVIVGGAKKLTHECNNTILLKDSLDNLEYIVIFRAVAVVEVRKDGLLPILEIQSEDFLSI